MLCRPVQLQWPLTGPTWAPSWRLSLPPTGLHSLMKRLAMRLMQRLPPCWMLLLLAL